MKKDENTETLATLDRAKLLGFRNVTAPLKPDTETREISDLVFTRRGEGQTCQ